MGEELTGSRPESEPGEGSRSDIGAAIYERLMADTWTTPKPDIGPDWHRRLPAWQCANVASLVTELFEQVMWSDSNEWHGELPQEADVVLYRLKGSA